MSLKNNLLVAYRRLKADKINTIISVAGLVLGLGIVAGVVFFISNELSYNGSFVHGDRIYRVLNNNKGDNQIWGTTPFILGATASNSFAEIEGFIHQYNIGDIEVKKNSEFISEPEMMCTESTFFELFGVEITQGSLADFDETQGKIVLSQKLAKKYFGNADAVGQPLVIRYNGREFPMQVAAVYATIPNNTTIKPALIANSNFGIQHLASSLITTGTAPDEGKIRQSWNMCLVTSFFLLKKGANKDVLEDKLRQLGEENEDENMPLSFSLQPLSAIYFGSNEVLNNNAEKGNRSMLFLLAFIGGVILLVATINYLNLASVKAMEQVKSLAVRKVCGAGCKSLIGQMLLESVFVSLLALPFAVLLTWGAMPWVSEMLGKTYTISMTGQMAFSFLAIVLITIASGLCAGVFISLKTCQFHLVSVLKGRQRNVGSKHYARKAMVVFQLAVFIVLMAVTFLIRKQVRYTLEKDLGFVKEGLISVPLGDHQLELFKQEIEKNPNVLSASGALWMPPSNNKIYLTLPRVDRPGEKVSVDALFVDYHFAATMGLTFIMGADFDREKNNNGVLVNESAVKTLGLTEVLGEQTAFGEVVGVVNDFNMFSLHEAVTPMLIGLNPGMCKYIAIRIRTENLPSTIDFLEKAWKITGGTTVFHYEFTDDILKDLYESDIRFSRTIGWLTVVAILIACLGLLGLSLLMGKQRTKEIGIRKVNGAKISEVMVMLNKDFVKWVLIAFVVATPVAWYAMHKWLENFAYKTTLSWWIFALAGVLALGIALLSVSWQSWRAATRNPVEALRYE